MFFNRDAYLCGLWLGLQFRGTQHYSLIRQHRFVLFHARSRSPHPSFKCRWYFLLSSTKAHKYDNFCPQFTPIRQTVDTPPNTPPLKNQLSLGSAKSRCDLSRYVRINNLHIWLTYCCKRYWIVTLARGKWGCDTKSNLEIFSLAPECSIF